MYILDMPFPQYKVSLALELPGIVKAGPLSRFSTPAFAKKHLKAIDDECGRILLKVLLGQATVDNPPQRSQIASQVPHDLTVIQTTALSVLKSNEGFSTEVYDQALVIISAIFSRD